ncbi:rRNA maturation RNase YbeY [Candidatus Peregrinibacteria bacterium]|nr:MAG: rRNA maturation RNase YbeY [Candidatus Peregrinibacteria bacterium]
MNIITQNFPEKLITPDQIQNIFDTVVSVIIKKEPAFQSWCESTNMTLVLLFVEGEEMKEINNQSRGKNEETDVLSFPYFIDFTQSIPKEEALFGELFFLESRLKEQAEYMKHSLEKEFTVLLIHGILHVFGYDHIDDDEYDEMKALEEKISSCLLS